MRDMRRDDWLQLTLRSAAMRRIRSSVPAHRFQFPPRGLPEPRGKRGDPFDVGTSPAPSRRRGLFGKAEHGDSGTKFHRSNNREALPR
jgi:hypothetical protein